MRIRRTFVFLLGVLIVNAALYADAGQAEKLCNAEIRKDSPDRDILMTQCGYVARKYEKEKKYDNASWYCLLAGMNKHNIKVLKNRIKNGFLANIAHSEVLEGDYGEAERLYREFLGNVPVPWANNAMRSDYRVLFRLYPRKRKNLQRGLALWSRVYKPLADINELYPKYTNAKKNKNYTEAAKYIGAIVQLQKKSGLQSELFIADNILDLGIVLNFCNRYDDSLRVLSEAEKIFEKHRHERLKSLSLLYGWKAECYRNLNSSSDAIFYFKKSLSLYRKLYGEENTGLTIFYNGIASIHKEEKRYKKALEYYERSLFLNRKLLGEKDIDTAISYENIGLLYKQTGDYKKALEYLLKALPVYEKIYGNDHSATLALYDDLGAAYFNTKEYGKALIFYKKSILMDEKLYGKESPEVARNLKAMSLIYRSMGDYGKALECLKGSISIARHLYGENSKELASEYDEIGMLYRKAGEKDDAYESIRKAIYIKESIADSNESVLLKSYNNLALLFYDDGRYEDALKFFKKVLLAGKFSPRSKSLEAARCYNNIAAIYHRTGDYKRAFEYYKRSISIFEERAGKDDARTAIAYNGMAAFYFDMGEYEKALRYFKRSFSINRKIFGEDHINTAVCYNNMALVYRMTGDYEKALEYLLKSLSIHERVLGKKHARTATCYNNTGLLYRDMGRYGNALEYYLRSMKIYESTLGEKHPDTANCYNNIGLLYQDMGRYAKAMEYLDKSVAVFEELFGAEHISTATSYNNKASVYQDMKDERRAVDYYEKSLAIYRRILTEEHPYIGLNYYNIGTVYQTVGKYNKAYTYLKRSFDLFLKNRDKNFIILDSKQKERYLKLNGGLIANIFFAAYSSCSKKGTDRKDIAKIETELFDRWLNYKGSIFDSENTIVSLYINTTDSALKEKISDLASAKRALAKLYQSFPDPKERKSWEEDLERLKKKISILNTEIAARAQKFKEQDGLKNISYADIAKNLKDDELYIDYAKAGGRYYVFTLDGKGRSSFEMIDENSSMVIDRLVQEFRDDIESILSDRELNSEKLQDLSAASRKKLSRLYSLLIEKPLVKMDSKASLVISPDAALKLLPFEALYDKNRGRYFIEEKEIRYVPSGRELTRLYRYRGGTKSRTKGRTVIFDDPDFDLLQTDKRSPVQTEEIPLTPNTNRAGIVRSLFNMNFSPLPGTRKEALSIKKTLQKTSRIEEYSESEASEVNLFRTVRPEILHIATHGFFINDDSIPNPMLKSGIALSGANASARSGKSDGIITALKLSGLDLKGTGLVVLSACETGVTDINSTESVSGLSKAFIQAGAEDIIISLWSVSDMATTELMDRFYREVAAGSSYQQALKNAKLEMIKRGMHPFFWAPFVLSGL